MVFGSAPSGAHSAMNGVLSQLSSTTSTPGPHNRGGTNFRLRYYRHLNRKGDMPLPPASAGPVLRSRVRSLTAVQTRPTNRGAILPQNLSLPVSPGPALQPAPREAAKRPEQPSKSTSDPSTAPAAAPSYDTVEGEFLGLGDYQLTRRRRTAPARVAIPRSEALKIISGRRRENFDFKPTYMPEQSMVQRAKPTRKESEGPSTPHRSSIDEEDDPFELELEV